MGPLEIMKEGNQRYVSRISNSSSKSLGQSTEVVCMKKPFAAVVTCFDSPVAPDVIFDCDSRDLMVVQVVGNLINDGNLVRLEYAVQNFDISLIVVIGHQQCRSVQAALKGEKVSGYPSNLKGLESAIEATQEKSVDAVCKMHTRLAIEDIFGFSEVFREKVSNRSLQIVGGFYCSDIGRMEWLD
jgi:carbonic anhydrase